MKIRLLLTSGGMVGVIALSYIYFHGHSRLALHHQQMLGILSAANEVEASLTANLLKSRDFLLLNYDPIVENEREMRAICTELKGEKIRSTALGAPGLSARADAYCSAIEETLGNVEQFKSRNAVLRNSVFYVQSLATAMRDRSGGRDPRQGTLDATLSYYLLPNESDRNQIERQLERHAPTAAADSTIRHVRTILERKIDVNGLIRKIIEAPSAARLDELSQAYRLSFVAADESASFYRSLLFWASILLLVGVLYGVTRIFQAARSLAEANERLESRVKERTRELSESQQLILQQQQSLLATTKMSALGEMAAGMAHEINNPLAIIQLNATQLTELLQQKPLREKLVLTMLDSIVRTTDRIARIVQGLRTFSRDGSHDPFTRVNVAKLVNETVAFCKERFRNHGVELSIEIADEALTFEGRATQISQVLLNLIVNAFDAVADTPGSWVRVSAVGVGDRVELRVTDSGPGISPDIRRKIFQPFFTTKEIGKGTGMGLSISLGIVQAHSGRLVIDEASARTSFVVELPRVQPSAESSSIGA